MCATVCLGKMDSRLRHCRELGHELFLRSDAPLLHGRNFARETYPQVQEIGPSLMLGAKRLARLLLNPTMLVLNQAAPEPHHAGPEPLIGDAGHQRQEEQQADRPCIDACELSEELGFTHTGP